MTQNMTRSEKISMSKRLPKETVIERFKGVHGDLYDYSKVDYKSMHSKVCIIDPIYGEFWQEPIVHLKGCGCPRRSVAEQHEKQKIGKEKFIERVKLIHPDYDFSNVVYVNNRTKVKVVCPLHGEFHATPDNLLNGKGCPHCGHRISKAENELYDFVCSMVGKDNVIRHDSTVLNGKELDIYVPHLRLAIEYNGLRWHSSLFKDDENYHLNKTLACKEKGIFLLQFFEDEGMDTIKEHVRLVLRLSEAFLRGELISYPSGFTYGLTEAQNGLIADMRLVNADWLVGWRIKEVIPPIDWTTDFRKRCVGDGDYRIYDCGSLLLEKK